MKISNFHKQFPKTAFFLILIASGSIVQATIPIPTNVSKQSNSSCTVTRSGQWSVDGSDCGGLPFTVSATETCSATAATCDQANSQAAVCAWARAVATAELGASAITEDCPAPPEP